MYSVKKLSILNIRGLLKVSDILYKCGKDMAARYDLHHWDNPHVKNWAIVALCALKNSIYLVKSGHAKAFYEHKGYTVYGETDTLKYKELKMKKEL